MKTTAVKGCSANIRPEERLFFFFKWLRVVMGFPGKMVVNFSFLCARPITMIVESSKEEFIKVQHTP